MYEFVTEGMTCKNCVQHVTSAVKSVDPKAQVDVSLEDQRVKIESQADREALSSAIEEAGYPIHEARSISPRTL